MVKDGPAVRQDAVAMKIAKVEIGHSSASLCHLGNICMLLHRTIRWDPAKEEFIGEHAKEANAYVVREMRKPYDYTFVG